MNKLLYVRQVRANMRCAHCGQQGNIHLHHPNQDGHLSSAQKLAISGAPIKAIDAEIARCVPLCISCHSKEHGRLRQGKPRKLRRSKRQPSVVPAPMGHGDYDLLTTAQVAGWFGTSQIWLMLRRRDGEGPPFIRIGNKISYLRGSVLQWLAQR